MATNSRSAEAVSHPIKKSIVTDESPNNDKLYELAEVMAEETGRGSFPPGCCHIGHTKPVGLDDAGRRITTRP